MEILKKSVPKTALGCCVVGEDRYHIITGTREVSPVVRGVGMALGGEEESAGQGVNVQ